MAVRISGADLAAARGEVREALMMSLRSAIEVAWGFLAVTVSVGCARHDAAPVSAAMVETRSADTGPLEGVWEGEVWETASYYNQGVRRVEVRVSNSGSWTASSGGTVCATGTATTRDGLVILDGHPVGPDLCVPRSLKIGDGRMWAVFETSFKGRTAPATIRLERVGERVPEGARASDKQ
jgi:hypothetical protein